MTSHSTTLRLHRGLGRQAAAVQPAPFDGAPTIAPERPVTAGAATLRRPQNRSDNYAFY